MIFKHRFLSYLILALLFLAVLPLWAYVIGTAPDNILAVTFFDVGQGDSIFLETPFKKQVLVDGGPDRAVLEKLGEAMSFFDHRIDLIVSTHPDDDHLIGLIEAVKHFDIGLAILGSADYAQPLGRAFLDLLEQKQIPVVRAQKGQKVIFPDGAALEILWPDAGAASQAQDDNNRSVVARMVYGETEFLLTGDIEKEAESYLVFYVAVEDLRADVLKTAHHGSKTSTGQVFLDKVSPEVAVISAGKDNRYDHPHAETLERLKSIEIRRTDENGDIRILTNGQNFNIMTEK